MPHKGRFFILIVLFTAVVVGMFDSVPVSAQGNLLINPGFETEGNWIPVTQGGGGIFGVPPGWSGWYDPGSISVPNGYPHRRIFLDENADEVQQGLANGSNAFIRNGNFSANFGRGGGAFTGAIFQQVTVPEASNVVGSAWYIMNLPAGADFQARVGVDPNGGADPNDTDIVWSAWGINQVGAHAQLTASATATGPVVTVFLLFRALAAVDPNGIYWDDASLSIGGAGGAAPGAATAPPAATSVPTAPPVVQFVQPQGTQPDGSIVHTVQSGDTLNAIAVAYGVPATTILELNGIVDGRLLRVGQQLLIVPAPEPDPDEEAEDSGAVAEGNDEQDDVQAQEEDDEEPEAVAQVPTLRPTRTSIPPTQTPIIITATPRPSNTPVPTAVEDEEPEVADTEEDANAEEPAATEEPEDTNTEEDTATEEPIPTEEAEDEAMVEEEVIEPTNTLAPTAPVAVADADERVDVSNSVASVCVNLFEDVNLNRLQESGEVNLQGGMIMLMQNGTEVDAFATDGTPDPFCFSELASGEYVAVAQAPAGYGLTTPEQLRVRAQAGSQINVNFGAAQGVEPAPPPQADIGALQQEVVDEPADQELDQDQIIQYLGIILIALAGVAFIGGVGAALLLRRG